jgi:YD repeat-containing protein
MKSQTRRPLAAPRPIETPRPMQALRAMQAPRAMRASRGAAPVLAAAGLAALLGALAAARAGADVHPNSQGGVDVAEAFQVGDVDNINLFNGSLTVTIALGVTYPVNAGLSYHLTLVANSNPWDFLVSSANQEYAAPSHCSNAGLGWRVSLGALGAPTTASSPVCVPTDDNSGSPYVYEAPDGSQHLLYATLHPNEPVNANVFYTRDGTYLRLQLYSGYSEIEFPGGTIHRFDAGGHITQMRDRFGNFVNVAYPGPGGCTGALSNETSCWQISDSQGRTQWIYFRSDLPVYNGVAPYGGVIDRVVLSAFGGAQAVYQFNYQVTTLHRGCLSLDSSFGPIAVPLLLSVSQPDGSSFAPGAAGYVESGGPGCWFASGSLTSLTLPTLGSIGWTYSTYNFPSTSSGKPRRQKNPGVVTRTTFDALQNVIGQWSYATALDSSQVQLVNTVTDPLGNRHVRYFSVATANVYGPGANLFDYGRQYTPSTPFFNLFLSEQLIDAAGIVRRTDYLRYERDVVDPGQAPPDVFNNNPREPSRITVYDGGVRAGTTYSDFDGVGHYRSYRSGGTFGGNDVRVERTDFNPQRNSYSVDQASNTFSGGYLPVQPAEPWVLGTSDYQYAQENGVTELRSTCYDPATGFLKRRRLYVQSTADPAAMSANDVLQVFNVDASGNLGNEQYFGGDNSPVAPTSSNLCFQALPASPEYQIDRGYVYGVNSAMRYDTAGFFSLNFGIDPSTGLPTSSRDTANIQTNFTYDEMGRLTYVRPRDGAWTQYLYHAAASPSSLASLTVDRQQNGSPATSLAQTKNLYNALGRLTQQSVRMPDGSSSARTTSYNALGWKTAVSEQGSPNVHVTQYLNYDAFGRPGLIRPPDSTAANGFANDVTMSYAGVQTVNRTVHVGTSWTGASVAESPATTTQTYDRFGRLASVTEASNDGSQAPACGSSPGVGSSVTTSYQYDPGNRLSQVSTPRRPQWLGST